MLFGFITWDVHPEIFRIGVVSIRWYSLFFVFAFALGYLIMKKIFRQEKIAVDLLDRLTWYMVFGTLIGARLGHCLFYEPDYYLQRPIEILEVWHGGLSSHGAAIGILLALFIFSRTERCSYLWILDRIAIVVALSGFLIRMGNLTNSEIYGNVTSLPWGFNFVLSDLWYQPPTNGMPCHPTQIYEALAYFVIFGLLCRMYTKNKGQSFPGLLFGTFLVLVFSARFLIEFIKENQVAFEDSMPLNMGQLLSIPLILLGAYFLVRPRKTHFISSLQ